MERCVVSPEQQRQHGKHRKPKTTDAKARRDTRKVPETNENLALPLSSTRLTSSYENIYKSPSIRILYYGPGSTEFVLGGLGCEISGLRAALVENCFLGCVGRELFCGLCC